MERWNRFCALYEHFAWRADPLEMGEFHHLLGHFLHEKPWSRRARGGYFKGCRLQRLPLPHEDLANQLMGELGKYGVPPDGSDALYMYLQYQDAMDELAVR